MKPLSTGLCTLAILLLIPSLRPIQAQTTTAASGAAAPSRYDVTKEITLTGEYKISGWLMTRAEFRTDWSSQPFFDKNDQPKGAKNQTTALLGLIAYIAPKK